jgi:hypothetical protein
VRVLVDGVVTKESTFADVAQALSLGLPYQLRLNADLSDAKMIQVGDGCQAMLGVPAEAALADGKVFYELVPAEDRDGLRTKTLSLIATGRPWEMETRVRVGGEVRWMKISAAPRARPARPRISPTSSWAGSSPCPGRRTWPRRWKAPR